MLIIVVSFHCIIYSFQSLMWGNLFCYRFWLLSIDIFSFLPFLFQWSVINELDKLPKLQSLDCRNNPIMDTDKNIETIKQLLIAKIGQLKFLNKSQVWHFILIRNARKLLCSLIILDTKTFTWCQIVL